jgi:hypothetical protein
MEGILKTDSEMEENCSMVFRYKGSWYKITPKSYESEYQTNKIAWMMAKEGLTSQEAYRKFFAEEQNMAKLLYPSFRKDGL